MFRTLLLLLLLLPGFGLAKAPTIRPPYLHPGDTVGIVAPAGKLRQGADTAEVRRRIEAWGLKVRFGEHLLAGDSTDYLAGDDTLRAGDLQQMIDDPQVRAVIAFKGGYGSVRLLDLVDLRPLRRDPKWIVGFSDITMLHMALRELGVESLHATMPTCFAADSTCTDASADSLRSALMGTFRRIELPPHPLDQPGTACGTIAGGNLTLVCSAIGTPEQIDMRRPTILLIEEVGESAYRLDRLMQQLLRSGMLERAEAILVGHLTDIKNIKSFRTEDAREIIARYTAPLGIPVVFGFPAGHEAPNLPVFMNREVCVTVDEWGSVVEF